MSMCVSAFSTVSHLQLQYNTFTATIEYIHFWETWRHVLVWVAELWIVLSLQQKQKPTKHNLQFTVTCVKRSCVCSIADPNLDMNDVICVELLKTSAGLGFSLDGGKASIAGDKPLLVKRIFKGTACMQWMLSQFSFCLCIVQTFQLLYSAFFWSKGGFCGCHLLPLTRPKWSLKEKTLLGMARDHIC